MQLGVCADIGKVAAAQAAEFDFIEESVQGLLQGLVADAEWKNLAVARASALPIRAANGLVPGTLKITGPEADMARLTAYMTNVVRRAGQVGIKTLVFGSGAARQIPEGFDRNRARDQIIAFLGMVAPLAEANDVMLVVEPLNRGECNVINSVAEAMEYVRAADHPQVQCLVDSYHFWLEEEPLENLRAALPWIKHVHVADKVGRVAPGESGVGAEMYAAFFRVLKEGEYEGPICVEALNFDLATRGTEVREFLERFWERS